MNIEAYDAESLRKLVRLLEYENRLLKDKLDYEFDADYYDEAYAERLYFIIILYKKK